LEKVKSNQRVKLHLKTVWIFASVPIGMGQAVKPQTMYSEKGGREEIRWEKKSRI